MRAKLIRRASDPLFRRTMRYNNSSLFNWQTGGRHRGGTSVRFREIVKKTHPRIGICMARFEYCLLLFIFIDVNMQMNIMNIRGLKC